MAPIVAILVLAASVNASAAGVSARADRAGNAMVIGNGRCEVRVSLASPEFVFADETIPSKPSTASIGGDILNGKPAELAFSTVVLRDGSKLDVRLFLQWSARERVLRKWAKYRLTGTGAPVLNEIVLERMDVGERKISISPGLPQSYPAFWDGCFAGVEFPIAWTRMEDGKLLLAHRPGLRAKSDVWYETRKAVYGIAESGGERQAFRRYVETNHPRPNGLHINYNSWWTSPVPYKESDILQLMGTFDEKLVKPYGARFDTFCIDMGWSVAKSAWEIDKQLFPDGFNRIEAAARKMNSNLGLWISPSSCYSPAMDNEWAEQNGYETFPIDSPYQTRRACLAGSKYRAAITQRLVDAVTIYGVRHVKLDGYSYDCPASNHGHEPGALSSEAVADGFVSVMQAVRKACPGVWLEPTCFGPNPSPWWLFYANSVTGSFGDDAPFGRTPSPIYRESSTTARDYYNLQGAARLSIPISGQEILGIVHQTPEPLTNDAVMCVMRGNMFLPVYVNPKYMDDAKWKALAGVLNWARKNAPALAQTEVLLPASWQGGKVLSLPADSPMPREPYGYAHWSKGKRLVALRNPWITPQTYSLKIGGGAKGVSVVSVYPEARVYARSLKAGDTLDVPLAPYETVVLSVGAKQALSGLPDAVKEVRGRIESAVSKHELKRTDGSVGLDLDCTVTVKTPQAQLLLLIEDAKAVPEKPACRITVDGKEQPLETRASTDTWHAPDGAIETGWASSSLPPPEHWRFMRVMLPEGASKISVGLTAAGSPSISAWVWATKPGKTATNYPNALPQPEIVSLDGALLVSNSVLGGDRQ